MTKSLLSLLVLFALHTASAFVSSPDWTLRAPLPTFTDLKDVTWTGSVYVAVGDRGACYTSPDGIAWTTRVIENPSKFKRVVWDGSKVLVASEDFKVWTSTDGVTWGLVETDLPEGLVLRDLVWTGSEFGAVVQEDYGQPAELLTSPDGISWESHQIQFTSENDMLLEGLTRIPSSWVVVGSHIGGAGGGVSLTSADKVAWTESDIPGYRVSDVAWNGTTLVAVGFVIPLSNIATSSDGITWTQRTSPTGVERLSKVIWTGIRFVAVGTTGGGPIAATSADGISAWTRRTPADTSVAGPFQSCVWNGTQVLAVGAYGEVQSSPGGFTWTRRSYSLDRRGLSIQQCVWTGTKYVALADSGETTLSSADGSNWSVHDQPSGQNIYRILWTGSSFLGIEFLGDEDGGRSPRLYTSTDGISWTGAPLETVSPSDGLSAIVSNGSRIVIITHLGRVITSDDSGLTWTKRNSPSLKPGRGINAAIWTGTQFVAVGTAGTVLTSPNGISWTLRSTKATSDLQDVAWSGATLVAVSDLADIFTSNDGNSWRQEFSGFDWGTFESSDTITPPVYCFNRVVWTGKYFIALCGENGFDSPPDSIFDFDDPEALYSKDGRNWRPYLLQDHPQLKDVTVGAHMLVAVGDRGAVYSVPHLPSVEFTVEDSAVPEYGTPVSLDVTLAPAQSATVTVPITASGSATQGIDYVLSETSLVFAPGEIRKTITVTPVKDSLLEPDEELMLALGTPNGGVVLEGFDTHSLTILGTPTAEFQQASVTVNEEAELALRTVNAVVTVPASLPHEVQVPFTVSGSATSGATKDYPLLRASPLVIPAGEGERPIPIQINVDDFPDHGETIIITLGQPTPADVLLGPSSVFTVTINDSDVAANIVTQPAHKLLGVGEEATLVAAPVGSPTPKIQWLQGAKPVPGAIFPDYTIASVGSSHAGSYKLKVQNGGGTALSNAAEVGIVDKGDRYVSLPPGKTATLTQIAFGSPGTLFFQWRKGGVPMSDDTGPNPRVSGTSTNKLVVRNLSSGTDDGEYTCEITQKVNSVTVNTTVGGKFSLGVYLDLPAFGAVDLPSGVVGGIYSYKVPVNTDAVRTPSSFSASGLPGGLKINTLTGEIFGRPTASAPTPGKEVTIKATNGKGTVTIKDRLIVDALATGISGTFHGLAGRSAELNGLLGSRIELSCSASGGLSGKVITGVSAAPFAGLLRSNTANPGAPTTVVQLPRSGKRPLLLTLTFNAANDTASGTLSDTTTSVAVTLYRNRWSSSQPAAAYAIRHNFALEQPDPDTALPQGFGFGSFSPVPETGGLTMSGKLADGSGLLTKTFIGPQGQVLIYQSLYGNRGSITGVLAVTAGVTPGANAMSGVCSWFKPSATSSKDINYPDGFGPLNINTAGGAYLPPNAGGIVMNLAPGQDNAALDFNYGRSDNLGDDFSQSVTLSSAGPTKIDNRATILNPLYPPMTMSVISATGGYSGSFDHPIFGKVSFQGLIVNTLTGWQGMGYLLSKYGTTSSGSVLLGSP